ncbi:chemotaxis protein CheD [Salinisphaera sp. T31B1]|uniref:chemotaxis protein CheD n=1 Tax=Salinisphaera sp. T31B1 TaxID=727963 RepID=UPI00333E2E40
MSPAGRHCVDPVSGLVLVKLLPGEVFVTAEDLLVTTVLGSCVATCLADPVAGVGGMNHFMLPGPAAGVPLAGERPLRYGRPAMDRLLAALYEQGARPDRIQAKAFGGASVLDDLRGARIGEANVDFLRGYLAEHNIHLVAEDLGDRCPRQLQYRPASGVVRVRRHANRGAEVIAREQSLAKAIRRAARAASGPMAGTP